MATIAVSKAVVDKQKGVVVLPVEEYNRLLARAVPEVYLTGRAALKLDKLVENGLREHRAGKTRTLKSLAELD